MFDLNVFGINFKSLIELVISLWALLFVAGCVTEGGRTVTFTALGNTVEFTDKAHMNDQGEMKYKAGFSTEGWALMDILIPRDDGPVGPPAPVTEPDGG